MKNDKSEQIQLAQTIAGLAIVVAIVLTGVVIALTGSVLVLGIGLKAILIAQNPELLDILNGMILFSLSLGSTISSFFRFFQAQPPCRHGDGE